MNNGPLDEPSVLDYVKAKLAFWRHTPIQIPAADDAIQFIAQEDDVRALAARQVVSLAIPWRSLGALLLALLAQFMLEPPRKAVWWGVSLYVLAYAMIVWAFLKDEWCIAPLRGPEGRSDPLSIRRDPLMLALPAALLAFLTFGSGYFNPLNLLLWLAAIALFVAAFWRPAEVTRPWLERAREFVLLRRWQVVITPWSLLLLAAAGLAIYFRVTLLNTVPTDMTSDHAEKLLDIWDVLHGKYAVFFPRNTGREMLTFYLTAGVAELFGTGISYASLKITTVLAGLLTLPYIYLLGKEVGNRRVALYALVFAAIAYWPNVTSRIGQRFSFYPLLAAPTLYYLIRGIRRRERNDFIKSGIALGLGLHGYSPMRIVPFVVLVGVLLYVVHAQSRGARRQALFSLIALGVVALILFIPLLRYIFINPEIVLYRSVTRLGTAERAFPGSPIAIFFGNLWAAVTMFFWSDGETWVHSVPFRPALDVVTAALFFLGVVLVWARYLRKRHWLDLFLIVSIPLLMMPSILSLAFPNENPSLNRTAAAYVPAFVIVGLAFDGLMGAVARAATGWRGKGAALCLGLALVGISSAQNYDLTIRQWGSLHRASTWNTQEMGHLIRAFADSVGHADSAWVVPYPYWVDTRLVGINAGYPTKDYALPREQLPSTLSVSSAKLFLVYLPDEETIQQLKALYPQGLLWEYHSSVPTKEFWVFYVPQSQNQGSPG